MSMEESKDIISREQLKQVGDLLTELRSINPTIDIISTLTSAQKELVEIDSQKQQLPSTGFLKKRSLKKEINRLSISYKNNCDKLLNILLSGFRELYFDLANNLKEIAKFLPDETENIKRLLIPGFNIKEIINFSSRVLEINNRVSNVLISKSLSLFLSNKETIELFEKFIEFDTQKVKITKQTTKESIQLLNISELIHLCAELANEDSYLKERKKGTEGQIQVAVIEIATVLQQHLDTINSIGLNLGEKVDNLSQNVGIVIERVENTNSVEELLDLEKQTDNLKKELLNSLRSYEISIKTETENQVGRILTIRGKKEQEDLFPIAPEINISSSDIPLMIQDIERLRSWHQKQIITIKRLISITELINTSKALQTMKIPIPEEFEEMCNSVHNDLDKVVDLNGTVNLFKQFFNLKSMVAEKSRNHFFNLLENPHVQEAISSSEGPKPLDVRNFEELSLTELVNVTREVREWETRLINFFSDSSDLNELSFQAKKARQLEVIVPEEFFSELSRIQSELMRKDLKGILELQEARKQLKNDLVEYIRTKIMNLKSVIDSVPSLKFPYDNISSLSVPEVLIRNLEEIIAWMETVSNNLVQEIQNARMNLLGMYDSREAFKDLLSSTLKEKVEEYRLKELNVDIDFSNLVKEIESLNILQNEVKSFITQEISNSNHLINTQLNNLNTIPPKLKIHAPILAVDDLKPLYEFDLDKADNLSIQNLLEIYEKIPIWSYKISSRIRENLKNIQFPLIPIETSYDLRERRNSIITLIDKYSESGNLEAVVKEYTAFLSTIEESRNEIIVEIKKELDKLKSVTSTMISLMSTRSISLNYNLKKSLDDMDYPEALTEYWQLKSFIERKVAILNEQILREIESNKEAYNKLPNQYVGFFDSILMHSNSLMEKIKELSDIAELVSLFQQYNIESLQNAKIALSKMHQSIYSRVRVSLPRINEVSSLSNVIIEAESRISSFTFEDDSHDQLAHKARQLIFLYDTEIVSALMEQVMSDSRLALKNINDLKDNGIDILSYVGKYIENFSQVIVGRDEEITIQEITNVFIEMDQMQGDQLACDTIRSATYKLVESIEKLSEYVLNQYNISIIHDERVDFERLGKFASELPSLNNIRKLSIIVIEVVKIRDIIAYITKTIEQENYTGLIATIKNLKYSSNIDTVFSRYYEEASESIFPLKEFNELREELNETTDLFLCLEFLPKIEKLKQDWELLAQNLDHWHRAIIMFLPRYTLTKNKEENIRQFKEIKKKIFETYTGNEIIREYLSLLVKMYIENSSGMKI